MAVFSLLVASQLQSYEYEYHCLLQLIDLSMFSSLQGARHLSAGVHEHHQRGLHGPADRGRGRGVPALRPTEHGEWVSPSTTSMGLPARQNNAFKPCEYAFYFSI